MPLRILGVNAAAGMCLRVLIVAVFMILCRREGLCSLQLQLRHKRPKRLWP